MWLGSGVEGQLSLLVVLREHSSGGSFDAVTTAAAPRPPARLAIPGVRACACLLRLRAPAARSLQARSPPAAAPARPVPEPLLPPPALLPPLCAGKSAVVNALLGQRYLAEGILPTTNEINVLKHLDPEHVEGAAQVGSSDVVGWGLFGCLRSSLGCRQRRGWWCRGICGVGGTWAPSGT